MNLEVEEKLIQQALEMDLEDKNKKISLLENANKVLKNKYDHLKELKIKEKQILTDSNFDFLDKENCNIVQDDIVKKEKDLNINQEPSDLGGIPESNIKRVISNKNVHNEFEQMFGEFSSNKINYFDVENNNKKKPTYANIHKNKSTKL